jgi:hypothetical protein
MSKKVGGRHVWMSEREFKMLSLQEAYRR